MNTNTVSRKLREISRLLDEVAAEIETIPANPPSTARMHPDGTKNPLPRMRTLPQAAREMRAADPDTCITLNALRQWVRTGEVSSRRAGKNYLVDLCELERFMEGGGPDGQH